MPSSTTHSHILYSEKKLEIYCAPISYYLKAGGKSQNLMTFLRIKKVEVCLISEKRVFQRAGPLPGILPRFY